MQLQVAMPQVEQLLNFPFNLLSRIKLRLIN